MYIVQCTHSVSCALKLLLLRLKTKHYLYISAIIACVLAVQYSAVIIICKYCAIVCEQEPEYVNIIINLLVS